jgi:hypothetical protein
VESRVRLFDDDVYVTKNPNVRSGLSWQGVRWAFTSGYASNWHPLTWLSHQLDCQLFGLNPTGHHIVNILFHAANAILLFVVLNRITKGFWQCAFIAALHPLHVESVAWSPSERRLGPAVAMTCFMPMPSVCRPAGMHAYASRFLWLGCS